MSDGWLLLADILNGQNRLTDRRSIMADKLTNRLSGRGQGSTVSLSDESQRSAIKTISQNERVELTERLTVRMADGDSGQSQRSELAPAVKTNGQSEHRPSTVMTSDHKRALRQEGGLEEMADYWAFEPLGLHCRSFWARLF